MGGSDGSGFLACENRPRVLYVIEQAEYSGAELGQLPVMRRDVDPLLACPPGSPTEALARSNGIPTQPFSHRPIRRSAGRRELVRGVGRLLASAFELRQILRTHPERRLVYCLTVRGALIASLASIGLGCRLMWHVTNFMPSGPMAHLIRSVAFLTAASVVPHSDALARDFAGRSKRLRSRSRTIYSGCHLELTRPPRVQPGEPRAVIVGDVSPTKRTDLAVDIAERVARATRDFELRIVGSARYRQEDLDLERRLRQRVSADRELSRRVLFCGRTSDIALEYAEAGLLLHCCPIEGFGIVVLEAMACGLPVVAPAAGGPLESVEHGRTGYLYPPGDADAAARYVLKIVEDRGVAERLGSTGRARYEELFSLDAMVVRTDAVLAALATGR